MKIKKIICALLPAIILAAIVLSSFAVDETNNNTGTEAGLGKAEPGNAQVRSSSSQQATTMWKISIFVSKDDKTGHASDENLTEDYLQFGSTFWIYRSTGDYKVVFNDGDYVATLNKEEYLRGSDKTFRKGKYKDLSYRIFAGESYGFTGKSDLDRVPFVPNCGTVSNMSSSQIINAMNSFFKGNANTSNVLIDLAAKASGRSGYEQLLKEMLEKGYFTVNGHVAGVRQFTMVDPYRNKLPDGSFEPESSSLAWVIMYEPVLRFATSGNSDADLYYVTASDVAALMCQGILNFADTTASGMVYRFSPQYRQAHGISAPDANHVTVDGKTISIVSKNCTTPFFVNLGNSVYLSEKWLGYSTPVISNPRVTSDDLWLIGNNVYAWYADTMLERGGFGLRFQKSNVMCMEFVKHVETDGKHKPDYSKITIVVTNMDTDDKYYVELDTEGKGRVQLPAGNYSVLEEETVGYETMGFESSEVELGYMGGTYYFSVPGDTNDTVTVDVYNKMSFHKITVNYRDKYTGEIIYTNTIA